MGGASSAERYEKPEVASVYFPEFRAQLPRMEGKVVAITGCTTGTGFICAKACAELGAHVVLLNRASERAEAALKEVAACGKASFIPCDLMSFESVRAAGARLREEHADTGLDVLCNNAGIMAVKDAATGDGFDTQMQTNHLSHFLLTSEVWPLLEEAASKRGEARVVNHSSGARNMPNEKLDAKYLAKNGGALGGDDLGFLPMSGPRWKRYQQTKLANVVFTYALDDRLRTKGSSVKSLVCHPGGAATQLQTTSVQDGGMAGWFTLGLLNKVMQSAEDGTMPLLTCVASPGVASRQFYGPKGMTGLAVLLPEEKEKEKTDEATRAMLWQESLSATGAKDFP